MTDNLPLCVFLSRSAFTALTMCSGSLSDENVANHMFSRRYVSFDKIPNTSLQKMKADGSPDEPDASLRSCVGSLWDFFLFLRTKLSDTVHLLWIVVKPDSSCLVSKHF